MGQTVKWMIGIVVAACVGAFIGWFARMPIQKTIVSNPLRLAGYRYTKPLLVCNTSEHTPEVQVLEDKLNSLIAKENIGTVSVYFQDFSTNEKIDIRPSEKFHAASIGKVPVMVAFYKLAESDPSLLQKSIYVQSGDDTNAGQEIKPTEYAKIGSTYAVDKLISLMIQHSDNNALYLLKNLVNQETIDALYKNLQIPHVYNLESPEDTDLLTTKDLSYFFRVLYNATYLTPEFSEKALAVLSGVEYKNGIVAGVPPDVSVAHKFGLASIETDGKITERNLNDCGIVYHPTRPYLLCVMSRSKKEIPTMESVIKDISTEVYRFQTSRGLSSGRT